MTATASCGSTLSAEQLALRVDAVLNDNLYWFPVRHHSAAVAHHLETVITQRRPKVVFLEGPAEAQELIPYVTDVDTRPPIALYSSYRDDDNVLGLAGIASASETIPPRFACWYPLLSYSPEYVAMQAAARVKAEVVFMDLPHFAQIKPASSPPPAPGIDAELSARPPQATTDSDHLFAESGFYQSLAQAAGYKSWDETWDTLFETTDRGDPEHFRRELATFCAAVRATIAPERLVQDGTIERERHFLQTIRTKMTDDGLHPAEVMVVCGGLHLFLDRDDVAPPPAAPAGTVLTTIVPYSFFRFSELSGYGAGNRAPQFYQTGWDLNRSGRGEDLLAEYVVSVLKQARQDGYPVSSADAISITQNARMLAGLRGRAKPVLDDIQDAIITCCCKGNPADEGLPLQRAIDAVNIGTKIGKVTLKLGRMPIVSDFHGQLSDLGLGELFDREKRINLDLDKRQPLDERRSIFLHRLGFLDVPLAELRDRQQPDLASGLLFRERWALRWSPKIDPALVEQNLYGDTIESAVLSKLQEQLAVAGHQADLVCGHLRKSIDMDLPTLITEVQDLCGVAVDQDPAFASLVAALGHLALIDRYAIYRNLKRAELGDLIVRCFDRACFALPDVASAPDEQHAMIVNGVQGLAEILLRYERGDASGFSLDRSLFVEHVRTAFNQTTVPYLRGAFVGMLAELREVPPAELARQVAAYAQTSADQMVFAGDFLNGILAVSRTSVMLGAEPLVVAIDQLLRSADWDVFLMMLPRLRAAFELLQAPQVDAVARVVARQYGLSADDAEELTELKTSVAAATLIADIDREVSEIMSRWSL
ncbi:MAG: hypothetical protein JSS49_05245 [Planctomycetes bacterium]|nr:hypothetical protein [Planctomycetota bacterium]